MKKITLLYIAIFISIYTNSIANNSETNTTNTTSTEVQRVRIDFVSPDLYTRHLLLGFTPDNAATDGFDYGYDGPNPDNFANDLNWLIEEDRFIIQGVGAFEETKRYPFGMFLADAGEIEISLTALENFDTPINVFIYDELLDTYTPINDSNYVSNMESGEYLNRFYITFFNPNDPESGQNNGLLTKNESVLQNTTIKYLSNTKELYINTISQNKVKQIQVYNLLGQQLSTIRNINATETKIHINASTTNYAVVNIETDYGSISKKIIIH